MKQLSPNLGEILIDTARLLVAHGLVARTWGNLSRRLGTHSYLITPSGRDYEAMTAGDLVEVDFNGNYRGALKPSGERWVHREIYRQRKDAHFVIHTHQPFASAMSLCGHDLPLPPELAARVGAKVLPISRYGLPSTKKLARCVGVTIRETGARAVLMQGHGAVLFGTDGAELVSLALDLEQLCRERFAELTGVHPVSSTLVRRFERDDFDLPPQILHLFMHREEAGAIIGDDDPLLARFLSGGLRAYLDDFSQLIGLRVGKGLGANLVFGRKTVYFLGADLDEAEATRQVAYKNALAACVAQVSGAKAIPLVDGALMRAVYKMKYSKLKDDGPDAD